MTAASQPKPVQTPSRVQPSGRALSSIRFSAWAGFRVPQKGQFRKAGITGTASACNCRCKEQFVFHRPAIGKTASRVCGLLLLGAVPARARGAAMSNPAAIGRQRVKKRKLGPSVKQGFRADRGQFCCGKQRFFPLASAATNDSLFFCRPAIGKTGPHVCGLLCGAPARGVGARFAAKEHNHESWSERGSSVPAHRKITASARGTTGFPRLRPPSQKDSLFFAGLSERRPRAFTVCFAEGPLGA